MVMRLCLILLAWLPLSAMAAQLIASVDRKEIGRSDTVSLQVRYDDMAGFSVPDWRVLERDWDIINQDQHQQISFNNGKNSSYTEWTLVLVPRRSGTVLIPPMEFKGAKSDPIRIEVSKAATTAPAQTNNFYFEVEISSGTHYVQEQILYIERLFYTVNHSDESLSDFTVADARIQPLIEPRRFTTVVDGKRIGVYERRYAIFPEEAGTLVIPGQRFSARPSDRFNRRRGDVETIVSKPIELTINPIPANYPQAPWIPASRFTLTESFSVPPTEWTAGEPVTRTFTLKATGLTAGQIPPVPLADIPSLRYYPDQSKDGSQVSEQGLITEVVQSVAIVPTATGQLTLPAVKIPWWNTLENRVEYAELPEHQITVLPGSAPTASLANQPLMPAPVTDASATPVNSQSNGASESGNGIWSFIAAALLVTNLLTLLAVYLLWRRPVAAAQAAPLHESTAPNNDARFLWRELKKAARNNDAVAIREGIIQWAAAASGEPMNSLAQAEVWLNDVRLSAALAELDATLYGGQENSAFNGQGLIRLIENAQKQTQSQRKDDALPDVFGV